MSDRLVTRRAALRTGLAASAAASAGGLSFSAGPVSAGVSISLHFDHVLGTSLDLLLVGNARPAVGVEEVVFSEVERLRLVFSLYDSASELSRVNESIGPVAVSSDMLEVLRQYERWQLSTGGACSPQVGALVGLWRAAEISGFPPPRQELDRLANEFRRCAWLRDESDGTVSRLSVYPLDLNAGAKGYVIRRIAEVIRSAFPSLTDGLVNLGGDILAWGSPWPVAIQDPLNPAENAEPLGGVRLQDAAIATSGGYERFFTVNGVRYSHLLDPRTGMPADGIASATVIARDSVTANILATTLCVLTPVEGLRLVAEVRDAAAFIVAADGRRIISPNFPLLPVAPAREFREASSNSNAVPWPEDFRLSVSIELPAIGGGKKYRRPYVAVWVEDADGKAVKTLTVWGNAPKYLKDLNDWWKIGKGNNELIKAVTRATRAPGKYTVAWDGTDEAGNAVGQGTFTVRVEVHREFGKHLRQSGKIDCKAEPATLKLDRNEETGDTLVTYGKKQP